MRGFRASSSHDILPLCRWLGLRDLKRRVWQSLGVMTSLLAILCK